VFFDARQLTKSYQVNLQKLIDCSVQQFDSGNYSLMQNSLQKADQDNLHKAK
jgi:hypothetical protein